MMKDKKMKQPKYDESSIQILDFPANVRKKPGMYIGSPDSSGIKQIAKEVYDNAIDEALAGRNKLVGMSFETDGSFIIWDRGGGIPVGKHAKTGRSTLVEVFARLHSGAKMDSKDSGYSVSTGTHGVGAACTNALSEFFNVTTFREKQRYAVQFKQGKLVKDLQKLPGKVTTPDDKPMLVGTLIHFKPDLSCFMKGAKLDIKIVQDAFDIQSYLHPEVTFVVVDKNKNKVHVYHQPDGYKALLEKRRREYSAELIGKPFLHNSKNLNIAVQWSDYTDEAVSSYINGSPTIGHGTHVAGFFKAINESLKPYRGKRDFTPSDLRSGLIGVVNYKMAAPMFDSQTKERLTSPHVEDDVYKQALPELTKFFGSNKTFARELCARAEEYKKLRSDFAANKKLAAKITNTRKSNLPAKLADSLTKNPKERELYIVEGDSAAGTAASARNKAFQAVLPIRGKILNVYGPKGAKSFDTSEEIIAILQAIGYDPKVKDPENHLRVGKIILLCDADVDGAHITLLVLSLLYKVLPRAFVNKIVYIVNSPLFFVRYKEKVFYGNTMVRMNKITPEPAKKLITRIKGWGEISAKDGLLQRVAFNKETRSLTRIDDVPKEKRAYFAALAGEAPAERRKLLFSNMDKKD